MNRRKFIRLSTTTAAVGITGVNRAPSILLRSSWQTVNIGDIAHTPGMLHLLEEHLPDTEVRLWPTKVDNGVAEMLMQRFPKLTIVQEAAALKQAFTECDFLLHGSGPSLMAEKDVERWVRETGKPYGIGGITIGAINETTRRVISKAKFAYFRDSVSLALAKDKGCAAPIMAFGPDAAFATDLAAPEAADAFLKAKGLEEGKFLCCIPRLRNTPYWEIHGRPMTAEDEEKQKINEEMKEHDHVALREAIIQVVTQTRLKIILCPEDQSQMAVGKEMIYDMLPHTVKQQVVWRESYWLTPEALSTYRKSAGIFGNEMHSPIMCIGNGIPAIVCRWRQQTSKGFMWRDIGLADWLFDMDDESQIPGIVPAVVGMAKDMAAAKAMAMNARKIVRQRQKEMMDELKTCLVKLREP